MATRLGLYMNARRAIEGTGDLNGNAVTKLRAREARAANTALMIFVILRWVSRRIGHGRTDALLEALAEPSCPPDPPRSRPW